MSVGFANIGSLNPQTVDEAS